MSNPHFRKSLEATGAQAGTVFGAEFGRFMRDETEKWGDVIKSSGISMME
jgi:tripartite-type tricarboxylate transporter receptor subunit TctC